MSTSPHSPEFRAKVSQEYLDGKGSYKTLATKYGIGTATLAKWVDKYKLHGILAFSHMNGNASYTKEFKLKCVAEVISGTASINAVAAKYNLSASSILHRWVLRYNANKELKDYLPERKIYMATARRKTTIDERKEIVAYCIEHGRDYKTTAKIYDVSYSQVYSWVKKYDQFGDDALVDSRGHHKSDDEVDDVERMRREILRLQKELDEQQRLVALLKKVKEYERG